MTEFFNVLGKASMRLATPNIQVVDAAAWNVLEFDSITVQRGVISANTLSNAIMIGKTGLHDIFFGINVEMNGTEELLVVTFVNGVQYSSSPGSLQGAGTGKPVSSSWISTLNLSAGDVVDLRIKNGDAGNFSATFSRLHFSIVRDS